MEMTPEALDALRETINLGVGKASGRLNALLETHIRLEAPEILLATIEDFEAMSSSQDGAPASCILLGFHGEIQGTAVMAFSPKDALALTRLLSPDAAADHDPLLACKPGTLTEVGNIVMVCILGTMGNLLHRHFTFDLPTYFEGKIRTILGEGILRFDPAVLVVKTRFRAEAVSIEGTFLILFELRAFDHLLELAQRIVDESDLIL